MSGKGDDKGSSGKPEKPVTHVDADAVRELAALLKETGLTEIEIEHNDARIRVSRAASAAPAAVATLIPTGASTPAQAPAGGPVVGAVPSPMVGTVFNAAEPGKPPFVTVGQQVKEGDTLFIVEAMKTMNAIVAPRSGTVKEICVENGQPVEFGQTLLVLG